MTSIKSFEDYYKKELYQEDFQSFFNKLLKAPGEKRIIELTEKLKNVPQIHGSVIGKIYISGPMSGYQNANYPAFYRAEAALRAVGYSPKQIKNPSTIKHVKNSNWMDFMREDLYGMMGVDGIILLKNWQQSYGAKIEIALAEAINKTPYHKFHILTLQEAIGINDEELAEIIGEKIDELEQEDKQVKSEFAFV